MSRTDKDRPYWLRSIWWEPDHYRCQYSWYARWRGTCGIEYDCDLPDRPVFERPIVSRWRNRDRTLTGPRCVWVPCHDYYYGYQPGGVPTWYVRLEYTGPARRRVRDELTRARQEYRATGEIDTIVSTTQHRHMARWTWW